MNNRTLPVKGLFLLVLLAGLTTSFVTPISFAREPMRIVTGTVTKVVADSLDEVTKGMTYECSDSKHRRMEGQTR